ncbi:MAG: AMP-binding protein [Flavobacteriaceae bacterium]|nr:AMP-binding protein [Flavobacteriaceae bacterium]
MSNSEKEIFDFKFYECEEKYGDRPFLIQPFGDKWETYNWKEVGQMARKLASGLKSLGLPEKSHIGLVSKNCREWVIADIAIIMAGYVSVPFFPNIGSNEISQLLKSGDVKALFVGKMEVWDEMQKGVPKDMPVIAFPTYKGHSNISKGHQWFDFINSFDPISNIKAPLLDDIWTIIFTSGTTGTPKGVVLTYRTVDNTKVLTEGSNPLKINFNGENHFFSYLPLNHIAERVVVEFTALRYGGTMSFVESLDTFAENLKHVQPTVFFAVPRIWTKFQLGILSKLPQKKLSKLLRIPILSSILKNKFKKALGLSKARAIVSGAAPMQESQRVWYRKLGINITNGYGMTENCAVCTQVDGLDTTSGTVGKVQHGVEIKIDKDSEEILMRGPYVMKEYYKDPKTTAETIKNGWLHTGDQGHIDENGYLYITGRVKDTFKTSKAKFIVPNEIEYYFGDIVDFAQICIVGIGNPQPMLIATLSEIAKSKDRNELNDFLSQRLNEVNLKLSSYQKVSTIILLDNEWTVESGLVTPTLKIKRSVVDKTYSANYLNWHNDNDTIIWEV